MTGFVLLLIVMTVAALAAIAWPFLSNRKSEPSDSDLEVYRAQLEELQRDREAGLIGAEDAEAARVEVSRRLLGVARRGKAASPQPGASGALLARRAALAFALLLVPLTSAAMYLRLGSPDLRSGTEATRTANSSPETQTIEQMIAQVEAHLQKNPNDGRGWEVLGPVYAKVGRYDDSVRAWSAAIDRLGETAERLEGLGEAMVAAADGVVTADAKSVFDRALRLDDGAVAARYYRGLAAKQDGLNDEAVRIWRDLIASAPPDAGWVKSVRAALARLEAASPETSSGATEKSAGAIADLPAGEQSEFVRSMVAGLAQRLKKDGSDPEGWVRLVRSYRVLGEAEKAGNAISDARAALAGEAQKLDRFENGLAALESAGTPPEPSGKSAAVPIPGADPVKSEMTERLAERLHSQGGEPDAWVLLVRSYKVLGRDDKANAALAEARRAFAASPEKLTTLEEGLKASEAAASAPQEAPANPPANTGGANTAADETDAMIRKMVEKLSDRLSKQGGDAESWLRLVRSYAVLGERDRALAAAADARRNISSDEAQLRTFDEAFKKLGLN